MHDVLIIGAGVAGMSAALWCDELNLKALVLEKEPSMGGQLHIIYNPIKNHLGVETENGSELYKVFLQQMKKRSIEILINTPVSEIDFEKKVIFTSDGRAYESQFLIIATGVRRRKLNVEGEDKFQDRGILVSGKRDYTKCKGKSVCIVGGGDAALENALILSEVCKKVFLVHRRENFRARKEFVEKVLNSKRIEVLTNTVVKSLSGSENLEFVNLENTLTKECFSLMVDGLLVRIGVQPNSELCKGKIELDENGYIRINENCETSRQGIFAIGDVASPLSPTISTAVGMGATVAKIISSRT